VLRFCLLGSGSSGNAVLVRSGDTKILIDNGLSLRQLEARAALVGESIDSVNAVFVTHEHADHVGGLGVLTRRYPIPVYMTHGTQACLPQSLGVLKTVQTFESGATIRIGALSISSFNVPHDAADPVSFVVQSDGAKLGLIGDLGRPSPVVRERLAGSHALILESNYCPTMLKVSSYPAAIRQRIGGGHGHLSNADASKLLAHLMHDALKLVVLTHISQENNTPEEALRIVSSVVKNGQTRVHVAHQDRPTEMFEIAV
jgi:phosphoribosyl 1,2-cyclic phosphodiesterase